MAELKHSKIDVDGVATGIVSGGTGTGRPLVFLHGGIPGVAPYAGGGHVWSSVLETFAAAYPVLAVDLLGSGGTGFVDRVPLIEDYGAHVLGALKACGIEDGHVIGHDLGGAVALWLGLNAKERAGSISVVASAQSTPLVDSLDNLTFLNPPGEPYAYEAQRWAYERVSYTPHHVDEALMSASLEAAAGAGAAEARRVMADAAALPRLMASLGRFKVQLWATAKAGNFPAPAQFIWGGDDPLAPRDRGFKLFETIGLGQPQCEYHLVSRSGSFVFREHPAVFRDLILGYVMGLAETPEAFRYS